MTHCNRLVVTLCIIQVSATLLLTSGNSSAAQIEPSSCTQSTTYCFSPNIASGYNIYQPVIWENTTGVTHTVTANPGQGGNYFDFGVAPGQANSFTFTQPGTYYYYCKIHSYMQGIIVVNAYKNNRGQSPINIVGSGPSGPIAFGQPSVAPLPNSIVTATPTVVAAPTPSPTTTSTPSATPKGPVSINIGNQNGAASNNLSPTSNSGSSFWLLLGMGMLILSATFAGVLVREHLHKRQQGKTSPP